MIPTNSSGTTNGCDNISSNCVVWQGPDIACINLCSGDTISEVTSKIATKVCDLITNGVISNPSLTGLDLTCLNISGTTPTTLVPVLQAMVTQICLNITSSNAPAPSSLPIMTLPKCLEYRDANGNLVTQLRLDLFATLIAQQVCTNLSSINLINSTLTSYSNRLDVLEACVLPCSGAVTEVQIIPTCVSNIGQATNVSIVVQALESAYCTLVGGTGTVAQMNLAIGQSSITSASPTRNNSSATYSSISGWNATATTLAQSLQNAWAVIDDLYAAVGSIQTNCCAGGCAAVTFAYATSTSTAGNGTISAVNFDFTGSTIPSTFNDSAGFSIIKLTDALGASLTTTVSVSTLQNNSLGFSFATPPPFNTQQDFSADVEFSVTDGVDTCEASQGSQIKGLVPCPLNIAPTSISTTGLVVGFTQTLGTTAVYLIEIVETAFNQVVATTTINNPPATISHTFTGLIANTAYKIRVTTTFGGATQVCPTVTFNTTTNNAACNTGMDVAFVIDYTSTNAAAVTSLQNGVAALISTIDSSSGSNVYRMSLTTSDQTVGSLANYAACADYTGLPSVQRLSAQISTGAYNHATAWEMMQNDNGSTFTSQLAKLNGGVNGTCVNMGSGIGTTNSPTNYTSDLVTGAANLAGSFRVGVAKRVIITTDRLPGGSAQAFNQATWSQIQTTIADANIKGIKYLVVGAGVDASATLSGTLIYPWRELATQTSGGYNNTASAAEVQTLIINSCS